MLTVVARKPDDLPACVELLRSVHIEDNYPVLWPNDPIRWLAPPREGAAWVGRDATSRIHGHVALHSVGDNPPHDLWTDASGVRAERLLAVSRLIVSPTHRREGIGEALLTVATRYAHEHGALPVLDVERSGLAAIRLYERLGWRRVGKWELEFDAGQRMQVFAYHGPPPS